MRKKKQNRKLSRVVSVCNCCAHLALLPHTQTHRHTHLVRESHAYRGAHPHANLTSANGEIARPLSVLFVANIAHTHTRAHNRVLVLCISGRKIAHKCQMPPQHLPAACKCCKWRRKILTFRLSLRCVLLCSETYLKCRLA